MVSPIAYQFPAERFLPREQKRRNSIRRGEGGKGPKKVGHGTLASQCIFHSIHLNFEIIRICGAGGGEGEGELN